MNFRDLERFQRRINRVQQVKKPPTLRMLVINEEPDEEGNPVTPEFGDLVQKSLGNFKILRFLKEQTYQANF